MAIIPAIKGLNVQISSKGQVCREFGDVDEDGSPKPPGNKVVVKYVQTDLTSVFEIHVQIGKAFPHHSHDLGVVTHLGGVMMKEGFYFKNVHYQKQKISNIVVPGAYTTTRGQTTLKRFKFHSIAAGKYHQFQALLFSLLPNQLQVLITNMIIS